MRMKMYESKLSKAQKQINKYFPKGLVAYQPGLTLVFKSVPVGLLLSQMLYWFGKGANKDGWIYKTVNELQAETGLSRHQQNTALKILRRHGIVETKKAGIPAKRHIRIDTTRLENLLPGLKQSANIVWGNPPYQLAENRTTTTKTTQENTTQNTQNSFRTGLSPIAAAIKQKRARLSEQMNREASDDVQ